MITFRIVAWGESAGLLKWTERDHRHPYEGKWKARVGEETVGMEAEVTVMQSGAGGQQPETLGSF